MDNQKDNQQQPQNPLPPPYPYYAPPQEEEINLLELWKILVEQKKIILFVTIISTLSALAYSLLSTPIYRAEALLAPVAKEKNADLGILAGQFSGLASFAGINVGGGGVDEAIATLKSRELTYKFIKDEKLIPILFENKWDAVNKQWKRADKAPSLWGAYVMFDKTVRVISRDKKTGLITLSIEWQDPELAARWVDKLVALVNKMLRQEAILGAEKSIKYLEAELQSTSIIEIKESIYNLIEAQTKTKMLANTQEEYAFRVIDSAFVPEEKIKPKRSLIIVLGFVIGGIFGVFIAIIKRAIHVKRK